MKQLIQITLKTYTLCILIICLQSCSLSKINNQSNINKEKTVDNKEYIKKFLIDNRMDVKNNKMTAFTNMFEIMNSKRSVLNNVDNSSLFQNNTFQNQNDCNIFNWKQLGLGTNGFDLQKQTNGMFTSIWVSPTDDNFILAGSCSAGLWKTTNAGESWTCLTDKPDIVSALGVLDIYVDPSNHQNIYIATGTDLMNRHLAYGMGLLKSNDGGESWAVVIDPINISSNNESFCTMNKIIKDGDYLYILAKETGIWPKYLDSYIIKYDLRNDSYDKIFKASDAIENNTIYKSAICDFEILFNKMLIGIKYPDNIESYPRSAEIIELDLCNNNFVRITEEIGFDKLGKDNVSITKKDNGFLIFSHNSHLVTIDYNTAGRDIQTETINGHPSWYGDISHYSDALTTINNDLYLFRQVVQKFNGNSLLDLIEYNLYNANLRANFHVDIRKIFIKDNYVYMATDGGLSKFNITNNSIQGIKMNGMITKQVWGIANSETYPDAIVMGAQDGNGYHFYNGQWEFDNSGDSYKPIYSPKNSENYYLPSNFASRATLTGKLYGNNPIDTNSLYVKKPFLSAEKDSDYDIYLCDSIIYQYKKRLNNNFTWQKHSIPNVSKRIKRLRISKTNPNKAYVLLDGEFADNNLLIMKSENFNIANPTWSYLTDSRNTLGDFYWKIPSDILIDPLDDNNLYISISSSTNQPIKRISKYSNSQFNLLQNYDLPDVPINRIIANPFNNSILCGTDLGVYQSFDEGGSWISNNNNLPNTIVTDLEFNLTNKLLRIATYGRGVWETKLIDANITNDIYPTTFDHQLKQYTLTLSNITNFSCANVIISSNSLLNSSPNQSPNVFIVEFKWNPQNNTIHSDRINRLDYYFDEIIITVNCGIDDPCVIKKKVKIINPWIRG